MFYIHIGGGGGKYSFEISVITKFFSKISLSLNFFETLSLSLKKRSGQKNFRAMKRNIASTCCTFNTFYFQYAKGAMLHIKICLGRSNFMISLPKNTMLSVAQFLVSLIWYTKTHFTAIECIVFVCILSCKMRLFEQGPITPNVLTLEQTNYSHIMHDC